MRAAGITIKLDVVDAPALVWNLSVVVGFLDYLVSSLIDVLGSSINQFNSTYVTGVSVIKLKVVAVVTQSMEILLPGSNLNQTSPSLR